MKHNDQEVLTLINQGVSFGARKALLHWQPIESAPKNGIDIIIYQADSAGKNPIKHKQVIAFWHKTEWRGVGNGRVCNPTHWKMLDNDPV